MIIIIIAFLITILVICYFYKNSKLPKPIKQAKIFEIKNLKETDCEFGKVFNFTVGDYSYEVDFRFYEFSHAQYKLSLKTLNCKEMSELTDSDFEILSKIIFNKLKKLI